MRLFDPFMSIAPINRLALPDGARNRTADGVTSWCERGDREQTWARALQAIAYR